MKTIEPQSGVGFTLKKGQRLKITDPHGQQVSDLFCFNLDDPEESLSAGRSIDYADSIYLTKSNHLYSNRSEIMMTIEEDTCGRHDFLMTPCSLKMFEIVAGDRTYHKSCHENLARAFKNFDILSDRIGTTFNIFMNVTVSPEGRIKILTPLSKLGDTVILRAEQNLIVALTACSHEETNAGQCKEIAWEILSEH